MRQYNLELYKKKGCKKRCSVQGVEVSSEVPTSRDGKPCAKLKSFVPYNMLLTYTEELAHMKAGAEVQMSKTTTPA